MKKTHSKVAQKYKTAQTEEFMFQNVAYRPTVYQTGVAGKAKLSTGVRIANIAIFHIDHNIKAIACRVDAPA